MTTIRCAISPDADDLFMFRGITERRVDLRGLDFVVDTADTEALNRMASGDGPEVSAISIAHYPAVRAAYQLLTHGGSVGRGYGPVVVAAPGRALDLRGARIGVPGLSTTACLVLRLLVPVFTPVVIPIVPASRAFDALAAGEVDAALLIHEGRLTFGAHGLEQRLDLGVAWAERTGLPLPLGGNVLRRDLPDQVRRDVDAVVRASIADGLADREAAIAWLLARSVAAGGPLRTAAQIDHYLSLYANADTVDYGADGRLGVVELLRRGADAGWLPPCEVDFFEA